MSEPKPLASSIVSLLVTLSLIASVVWAWRAQLPADNETFSIAQTPYSTHNAWEHLRNIAKSPHYSGSQAHASVKNYIVAELEKMGLQVEVQSTLALSSKYKLAANVQNIIAKKPATTNTSLAQGLALMSHYDSSTYSSFGASDAGSGVAVILEAIQTLITSQLDHSNDIYIIITDAEEQGLLGAEAFIKEHPYAKSIDLVLNFEARGSGGPSYTLLETNGGNRALIEAYAQAGIRFPTANSLMYSIYKMLPNDTDLTVFREKGNINGFNFAFIDDHYDYHTAQDTVDRLNPSTFNHQVDYISALLPALSSTNLEQLNNESDNVYVNFANLGLIDYPFSWVLPSALILLVLFVLLTIFQSKKGRFSFKNFLYGLIPALVCISFAGLVGWGGWQLILWYFPQFADIRHGFPYSGDYIIAFGILLAMSASAWFYNWATDKFNFINAFEWYAGIVLIWLVINLLFATYLTGAGFFVVISIATLLILWQLDNPTLSANKKALFIGLVSIPGLVLITPQIPVFVIGLGLDSLTIATILSTLMLMTLLPLMFLIKGIRSIQLFMTAGALISLIGIGQHAHYNVEQKKPSGVNYLYDTDKNNALLFSYDLHLDEFTKQFFSVEDVDNHRLTGIYPVTPWRNPTFSKKTVPLNLSEASFLSKSKHNDDGSTTMTLTVMPNRPINFLQLSTSAPIRIDSMTLNGQTFSTKNQYHRAGFILRYVVSNNETVTLNMTYRPESRVSPEFRLIETAFDLESRLPEFVARPEHLMPTAFRYTDSTIISQSIE